MPDIDTAPASIAVVRPPVVAPPFTAEWATELDYRLVKELWSYADDRTSVRFEHEWRDAGTGQWMRTRGNEHWEFDAEGLMRRRDMSANDDPIPEAERRHRRPAVHRPLRHIGEHRP